MVPNGFPKGHLCPGQIFKDDVVASAILDRLLHYCYPLFIQGKSYRMRQLTGSQRVERSESSRLLPAGVGQNSVEN